MCDWLTCTCTHIIHHNIAQDSEPELVNSPGKLLLRYLRLQARTGVGAEEFDSDPWLHADHTGTWRHQEERHYQHTVHNELHAEGRNGSI